MKHPRIRIFQALPKLWRLLIDGLYRRNIWTFVQQRVISLLPQRAGTWQAFGYTRPDRYPHIFRFVQSELGADRQISLLSFGCSTGEEVDSLRQYFPQARIKGLDISQSRISACNRRLVRKRDGAISFAVASTPTAEPNAHYDAVFCLSVLRHDRLGRAGVERCDHLIRFEEFSRIVSEFDRCLKPGGLLIIRHSNFRLCDAPAGAQFAPIMSIPMPPGHKTPIFGPDNCLMRNVEYPDTVFRKRVG